MWSLIGAAVKGFFSSVWSAFRQRRLDDEKEDAVETHRENAALREQLRLQHEKNKTTDSDDINDAVSRFK